MGQLASKTKQINRVYLLCWIVYCCSYFGRYNFSAAIADIVSQGLYTKTQLGVVGTVFFVVYGSGQLINGILGDRFSPYKMIFFGTFVSSLANLAMCFASNLAWLCVVWGVNGFAQSMLWAPIIYIVSNTMQGEPLKKAEAGLAATMPAGTLSAYAVTTVVIRLGSWKTVFMIAFAVLMAISLIWGANALFLGEENRRIVPLHRQSESSAPKRSFFKVAAASGFAFMILPVMLHAMLKDGVMTWVPTMIMELFRVTPSFSTMLTIVLPVLNFFGAVVVTVIYNRGKLSEARIACLFFAFSLLPLTALLFIQHYTPLISVIFLALITSTMSGINHVFLTLIPVVFAKEGRAATMAGVIDCVAYAGSALSTYGFGKIAESFGWSKIIIFWLGFAAVAFGFCLLLIKKWEQYTGRS